MRRGRQRHSLFLEIEGIRGEKGPNLALYSWSFGSDADEYGTSTAKKQSTEPTPDDWTNEQVVKWLTDEVKLGQYAPLFVEHDITGNELKGVVGEDLKALGITSIGHRLSISVAITKLPWKVEAYSLRQQENRPVEHSGLRVMKRTDIASPQLLHACWSKRELPKAYLKMFREPPGASDNTGGGGLALSTGDDAASEQKTPEPYLLVEMTGVRIVSVQHSGSSETPSESVSLSFKSMLAFHYRDLALDAYSETAGGISVYHDLGVDKINLVKIAADPTWSHETHFRFPVEFRAAVKSALIYNRRKDANVFSTLPKEVVLYIVAILSINYEPVSPLKTLAFPEEHKKADQGNDYY